MSPAEVIHQVRERIAELEKANELILRPLREQLRRLEREERQRLDAERDRIIAELEKAPAAPRGFVQFEDSMGYE